MHGNSKHAALEIPQRDVHDPEEPDRKLLGPVELPEPMPEPFPLIGPLPDELITQNTVDDVGEHRAAPFVIGLADRTVFSRDPEDSCRAGLRRAA